MEKYIKPTTDTIRIEIQQMIADSPHSAIEEGTQNAEEIGAKTYSLPSNTVWDDEEE